jgi:proline iminopeptidase
VPLFPEIEPYAHEMLPVSDLHSLYVEQVGNPEGPAVVVLHGGPGGGCGTGYRRYFDPAHWRIILFDQRGAGRSTPFAELRENTTWLLVQDIETIRRHLGVDRWVVFGGSWGSTLALAYATSHTAAVRALCLRGIFLGRQFEYDWLYGPDGAARFFPDEWAALVQGLSPDQIRNLVDTFYEVLTGPDQDAAQAAAMAWSVWEGGISRLVQAPDVAAEMGEIALPLARIETHYFVNRCWLPSEDHLIDMARMTLGEVPTFMVNGRYDVVCPPKTAWDLKQAMPHAELVFADAAGHSVSEEPVAAALIDAMERFKGLPD